MDAARVTRVRIEGRSASGRVETRRESLMVGPVGQSMDVRESRAAWRAWASRWPTEADADHTVLQCTCSSKGVGKGDTEGVEEDRGAH